jgi:hypothetical protein
MLPEDLADACRLEARDCGAIVEPTLRDECGFLRAESSGDYGDCASAGRYVEECRMHLWSADIARWEPAGVAPGDLETEVAARAALAGFAADDPRPWSAWYRQVLGRMVPLDRAQCEAVTAALPREACLHTALLVYDDRLNVARDKRLYPCDGGELPPLLRHAPDTAIQARIAARTDLCP